MKRRQAVALAVATLIAPRAFAQGSTQLPRIALVDPIAAPVELAEGRHPYWGTLLRELRKLGYVEGKTLVVDRWSGNGNVEGYTELVGRVQASQPALIVTRGRTLSSRFATLDKHTPIVMLGTIAADMRGSLAHPGGNVTGVYTSGSDEQIYVKHLEFVRELTGPNARIAWLGTRVGWENPVGKAAQRGAMITGLTLELAAVRTPVTVNAVEAAFASIRSVKFDAIVVSQTIELFPYYARIAELAIAARLRAIGTNWEATRSGLLLSYGPKADENWRRIASFVDRILKGAQPGDLPIEQPNTVELTLNLKTARALGIQFPESILSRADRVAE